MGSTWKAYDAHDQTTPKVETPPEEAAEPAPAGRPIEQVLRLPRVVRVATEAADDFAYTVINLRAGEAQRVLNRVPQRRHALIRNVGGATAYFNATAEVQASNAGGWPIEAGGQLKIEAKREAWAIAAAATTLVVLQELHDVSPIDQE